MAPGPKVPHWLLSVPFSNGASDDASTVTADSFSKTILSTCVGPVVGCDGCGPWQYVPAGSGDAATGSACAPITLSAPTATQLGSTRPRTTSRTGFWRGRRCLIGPQATPWRGATAKP